MDAVKFLEEYSRMCNAYNDCVGCPMHDKPFCHPHDIITNDERKELVNAVEKWSCEHSMVANDTSDTVSRAAAIDAIDRAVTKEAARWSLQELPSAQPEPLTDKEQRIFLAAMGREEKVCKQVDAECRDCKEPYEDSLVRTCHEIIRKVKGALWTQ